MKHLGRLAVLILLAGGILIGLRAQKIDRYHEALMVRYALMSDAKTLGKLRLQEALETLSLGFFKNELKEQFAKLKADAKHLKEALRIDVLMSFSLLLLAYALALLISLRDGVFWGAIIALVMLYLGSSMTLLSVTLHKEVAYLGDIVFSHESKSLFATIQKLWGQREFVIAVVVVVFSVVVPWIKGVVYMVSAIGFHKGIVGVFVKAIRHLGKWSMLDVFVVAILLVFLSLPQEGVSRAKIGEGVYFFAGYVVLSLVLALFVDRLLHKRS